MESSIQLSENAILYISSGFDGPHIMQIIAFRAISPKQYQLCLTDGRLYIGGKYVSDAKLSIPIYSIVKVECKFNSRWSPIQVLSLEVVSTSIKTLIGKSPATLHDYFQQQKQFNKPIHQTNSNQSQQSANFTKKITEQIVSRKRVKLTIQNQTTIIPTEIEHHANSSSSHTQKINSEIQVNNDPIHNAETQSLKFKSDSQSQLIQSSSQEIYSKEQSSQNAILKSNRKNKNQSDGKSEDQSVVLISKTQPKVYVASEHEVVVNKSLMKKNQTHNVYISDLYQRMPRWKILSRVVSLRTFVSAKGKKCSIMLLIDQKGDQMKAMYYFNKNGKCSGDILEQGKVYSFTGGQVTKSSAEDCQQLQIVLDQKSQIIQYEQIFIYPYSSKRNTKYQDLLNCKQFVNVIGIVKSSELAPANSANYKSKPKIKGVICNPIELYEIQFSKSQYSGEKELVVGSVYVLINFSIVEAQNAIKLLGSNNSFIVKVSDEDLEYNKAKNYTQYQELNKIKKDLRLQGQKWKKYEYHNLSEVKYSKRTVNQMKNIVSETDSIIYSEILVSIADIKLKKQYMACPICKRSTIQQQQILYQCLKCKKIVDPFPNLIISLILADGTGSFQVDVIGDKAQIFIGIQSSEFCGLSAEDKECTLQISKYSQFAVKLKTQKKSARQIIHNIQNAQKQQHTLTMQQIRRRTVEQKLKLQQKWDYFD